MIILTLRNDVLYRHIKLCFKFERQLLQMLKKKLKLSFRGHLCDKCDNIDDDIVACDDRYHLMVFLLTLL